MFHVHHFVSHWLVPVLLIGVLGGCEAAPRVEAAASGYQQQYSAEDSIEDVLRSPEENHRTTVIFEPTEVNNFASFMAAPQSWTDPSNGTGNHCVIPPCIIERVLDAKPGTATVTFAFGLSYPATVLDEPIVTLMGILKGSAVAEASAKRFSLKTSIPVNEVDHTVAIMVDVSDFGDISSVELSWISGEKNVSVGSNDFGLECRCCEWKRMDGGLVCTLMIPGDWQCP